LSNLQLFKLFEDSNENCFSGISFELFSQIFISHHRIDLWTYNDRINSSLTIFSSSWELNETYQLMVQMIHRQNSSLQSIEYLTIKVENNQPPIILIKYISFFYDYFFLELIDSVVLSQQYVH
jgi:hypothetical protein